MIILANGIVVLSVAICMIDNSATILLGRLFNGVSAGAFTVYVPKFIAELTPKEYRGPLGSLSQFMATFGIFTVSLMGVPIPTDPE
jgi:MFS family permease